MEEIIKNQQSVRETYCLYPRFLQIALEHRLTEAQLGMYSIRRLFEPQVLSLRPIMVLLNNAHYPNVVIPARVTNHIQQFFNSIGLVAEVEQVVEEDDREGGDDQGIDSTTARSESMDLDQTGANNVPKTPENTNTAEGGVAEKEYIPGQEAINPIQGNILNFDLSEFFGSEYLSFLDSIEPTSFSLSEPSVAILTGNESRIPPVLTTAEEQQTQSLFTQLPLKRKILFVNERVNHNKAPKSSWFNMFVHENTALPPPKMRKLDHEATVDLDSTQSPKPNTSPIQISEDELTEQKGGDTDCKQPNITLSNVSTSPESPSLDPMRDLPRSDLSGGARQLSGNSSSDESDMVYYTHHPSQGYEGNVGSPLPNITLPTSPLPEGTFPAPEREIPPTKSDGGRQVLGKSSSDEPSTIFFAGTSGAQAGKSVSNTLTERLSVHKSPRTPKPSERAQSDTPPELVSETPLKAQTLNLDNYVTKEKFEQEISKRDREISSLKSRLQLDEVNMSMTQAAIQAIQKQLAALSTPQISSIKDFSTEGGKKTQAEEKAEVAVEGKCMKTITYGESSFSHALEDGEIDEPYMPEYVEKVFTVEEFNADEAQVDEEDEFADEYAFHNDCLFSGIDEVISSNI